MVKARSENPGADSVVRSALGVGFITFLSRLTGLLRDYTFAHFLGTSLGADAFRVALMIPNIFRRLVGEGAISTAFVPVLTRWIRKRGPEETRQFVEKFFTIWSLLLAGTTLVGMLLAVRILLALTPFFGNGWTDAKIGLTADLTIWLFPYLFLIGLAAVANGVLNSFKIFALPATTPLLYNLAFVAAGYFLSGFFPGDRATFAFAIGVLAGGLLQFSVLVPSLWKLGIRFRPSWPGGHEGVREVLRLFAPAILGAGVYQINVLVSLVLAMMLPGEGNVAALGFAGRLMEFVLGVFVFALSTVSLPTLASQAADDNRDAFRATFQEVLRLTGFITIPSAVGLFILGVPVIELVLKTGQFDDRSVELTAVALRYYVPGIFLVGLNRMLVSGFYALRDVRTPVKIAAVNLIVNLVLAWILMKPLGHGGIALASTLSVLVQAVWLFAAFARREPDLLRPRELLVPLGRAALSALIMAPVCGLLVHFLPGGGSGRALLALSVGVTILVGAVVYMGSAILLRSREPTVLLRALSSRFSRREGGG